MKHTRHQCPKCGAWEACISASQCLKNGTTAVTLLCEACARKRVASSLKGFKCGAEGPGGGCMREKGHDGMHMSVRSDQWYLVPL